MRSVQIRGRTVLYPVAIEIPAAEDQSYGVAVPDLPGCFSGGDTLTDAIHRTVEAIELHLQELRGEGASIPEASSLETYRACTEFAGRLWALVEINPELDEA
jgi:predicted RNase H-like HicB family nuclease